MRVRSPAWRILASHHGQQLADPLHHFQVVEEERKGFDGSKDRKHEKEK
jgi:hypothetical protein